MGELAGKVALVTGGSRGIGAAVAARLARDGADVALTYIGSSESANAVAEQIKGTHGTRALVIRADSADPAAVIGAIEQTVGDLGRLDILVNNAGVYVYGPLEDVTPEQIDLALAVHVRASFVAAQAAARHMGDGGRIISIGSCSAEHVPGPGMTLYAMTKAALIGMTKGLARDLGPRGITATVVEPGPIDTEMNPRDGQSAEFQRLVTALGRYGTVDDVAATVAHLAGEGGRYVTGTAFVVDGGWTA